MIKMKQVIELPNVESVRAAAEPYKPPSWHRDEEKYCVRVTLDQNVGGGSIVVVLVFKTQDQPCGLD